MSEFEIPHSVKEYFGNKKVKTAVDDLVGKLDGKKMIECDWQEAQNYNQALLFAAQVRTDYIDMFYRLWDATFGKHNPNVLGDEYFEYWVHNPSDVWSDAYVEKCYYRAKDGKYEGSREVLILWRKDDMLGLYVYRFSDNENLADPGAAQNVDGWNIEEEEEEQGKILVNSRVKITDFIEDPDSTIRRFSDDAKRMIAALKAD